MLGAVSARVAAVWPPEVVAEAWQSGRRSSTRCTGDKGGVCWWGARGGESVRGRLSSSESRFHFGSQREIPASWDRPGISDEQCLAVVAAAGPQTPLLLPEREHSLSLVDQDQKLADKPEDGCGGVPLNG